MGLGSVNSVDSVLRRLQNAVDQRCSYTGCKLGCETDDGRDGKHEIVQENQVEVTEPFQTAVVAQ